MLRALVVGSTNVDLVLSVDRHVEAGETLLAKGSQRLAGGKGANQAVALARLGAQTIFVSAVGDDADGRWSLEQLTAEGIDVTHVDVVAQPTGLAVVSVDAEGENSIVVVPGANAHVRASHAEADVVLLSLEIPMSTVEESARTTAKVVLNAAPFQPLPATLLANTDVLVVNEGEYAQLGAVDVPAVVITLGGNGARVITKDGMTDVAPYAVEVVDTTGAGDCFAGALAYGIGCGEDVVTAVRRAVVASALSVRKLGARTGMPALEELTG